MDPAGEVTRLLRRYGAGDAEAGEALLPLLYDQLHALAGAYMRAQRADHTLQPTALLNEAFVRLVQSEGGGWNDREHFLALAARAMRSALVDHARARRAAKRGGGASALPLDGVAFELEERAFDLVLLGDALESLASESERAARIVELRFFAGLTAAETAEALGVSLRTVERDWRAARAWLYREMGDGTAPASEEGAP